MAIVLPKGGSANKSNKILGIFLTVNILLITVSLFYNLGELSGRIGSIIIVASMAIFFLLGPLIYYFVSSIFSKDITLNKSSLIHLIPFILFCLFSVFILNRSFSFSTEGSGNLFPLFWEEYAFYCAAAYLLLLVYIVASYKTMRENKTNLLNITSSIDGRSYSWLKALLLIYFFHWLFDSLAAFFGLSGMISAKYNIYFMAISIGMLLLFSTLTVFRGLKGFNIISIDKEKYLSSTLSLSEKESVKNKILSGFAEDKLHLNPDLTLDLLAENISVHSKSVSQVINEAFKCNFFDFVNGYRINEAKQIILKNGNKTILEILYASGFNSKSAFNRAFKKHTGYTPTEFRKINSTSIPI